MCEGLCGVCGFASLGSCCEPNATYGCSEDSCCESVCAVDPSCCDAEGGGVWDQRCADLAWEHCPDLDGCSPPPPPTCGDAGAGDCCQANGSPLCEDAACCKAVCAIDSYCCEVEWDECCAQLADENCPQPGAPELSICDPPPECRDAEGDCCSSNGSPGCNSPTCCAAVCAVDPFCCEVTWDGLCADATWSMCDICECDSVVCDPGGCEFGCGQGGLVCWCDPWCFEFGDCCEDVCDACPGLGPCPPINPADLTGDNTVGVDDLLILLAAWGDCPNIAEHCPDPAECPADFNDDLTVGVDDLLFLLENWG